jgi:hypothetical protein
LNTDRQSKNCFSSCMICLLISTLIFLSNDRCACGSTIKHSQTSRVCQTCAASHCAKHSRSHKVGVIKCNWHFDVGHSSKDSSLQGKTFNATHSHAAIVEEVRDSLGIWHRIIRGVEGIVRLQHQAHKRQGNELHSRNQKAVIHHGLKL